MEKIKEEMVGYLPKSYRLVEGKLILYSTHIAFESFQYGGGLSLLKAIFNRDTEKDDPSFTLQFSDIKAITQGKHGLQKNVLEIYNQDGKVYRLVVRSYVEWEYLMNQIIFTEKK
jgi:hypothetical protein